MLDALNSEIKEFYAGQSVVFGDGKRKAKIMLIGEAPGKDEVLQGRPFVGKAGKNLAEFLETLGLLREDVYISNVCKFRPTKISEKNTVSNRPPKRSEILDALPFLKREIELIDPSVIVTLGNVPLRAVTGDFYAVIGDFHGKMTTAESRNLFALYHPASIIYNRALKSVYESDLQALKSVLQSV